VLYNSPDTVCRFAEIAAHLLIRAPPDFEKLTKEHPCPNPGGVLPLPLEEMNVCVDGDGGGGSGGVRRKEVPMMIPAEVIAREKATYGWYLTHIYSKCPSIHSHIHKISFIHFRSHAYIHTYAHTHTLHHTQTCTALSSNIPMTSSRLQTEESPQTITGSITHEGPSRLRDGGIRMYIL
jgi:hypothetical protein